MLRRRLGVITAAFLLTPVFVLLLVTNPDLSNEQSLVDKVTDLRERLHHAELINRERKMDVTVLSKKLRVLSAAGNGYLMKNLTTDERELIVNQSVATDIHLPSIYDYLPHLQHSVQATIPAFKLAAGKMGATMVLGIPTVKRGVQSYLIPTLENLLLSMSQEERQKTVIVVLVAEFDMEYVHTIAGQVENKFGEHVKSGLIEVISPPVAFYPDLENLRPTLGDPPERVRWRTKQNLDYAFLMMYCQPKATYYVQLEDDIQTKKGFIKTMHSFALLKSSEKKNWIVLDFCQLGFIGKMFKTVDVPSIVTFLLIFNNDQPCDWLLIQFATTRVCRLDSPAKSCKAAKDAVWIHYKPSIFQHVGTYSSLKGKVQKLKDKQYGKVQLNFPHSNPPAVVTTDMKAYKTFTLVRAYKGDTYFWGLLPQAGDTLTFKFNPPVRLAHYLFRSGNLEHPSDKLTNTTVEVLPVAEPKDSNLLKTKDNFVVVGEFNDMGMAKGDVDVTLGLIGSMRLRVHAESENWAILSEIFIQPAES